MNNYMLRGMQERIIARNLTLDQAVEMWIKFDELGYTLVIWTD